MRDIESIESLRLIRDATGYLTRLRELRNDVNRELTSSKFYHAENVIGHLEDYNRILEDIRRNPSFKNTIKNFENTSYKPQNRGGCGYQVILEGRTAYITSTYEERHKPLQTNVPMDGTTTVETFVYPRLSRLTKDVEHSLLGRCSSGKRPD